MDLQTYMQSVAKVGVQLDQSNPSEAAPIALGTLFGMPSLGESYPLTDGMDLSGVLGQIASRFQVVLEPVPALGAEERVAVMFARLTDWANRAEAAVRQIESAAGIDTTTASASALVNANDTIAAEIESKGNSILGSTGNLISTPINLHGKDLALALRKQYNAAVAGLPLQTPAGVQALLQAGAATQTDLARDYFQRMSTLQAITQIGNSEVTAKLAAVDGLGFFGLIAAGVLIAIVSIFVILPLTAAIVVSRANSERNAIWSEAMKTCSAQSTSSEFCKQVAKGFSEDSLWGTATGLRLGEWGPLLLVGALAAGIILLVPRKQAKKEPV